MMRNAAAAIAFCVAASFLSSCNLCPSRSQLVCDATPLGEPPALWAEGPTASADGAPPIVHTWKRCNEYTLVHYNPNQLHTSQYTEHYEDGLQIYSQSTGVHHAGSCTPPRACGRRRSNEAPACEPYCLWWDYLAGTDQAELPPGDPGWCEDSPWKDFVYEP